ncbi:hypothetical protein BDP27DRAFT_1373677 [Rhodocollybia butyracea]|uniref:Uncharacterized protein n=1 Tax=Rhodocollybia butyracea TaxID=206335 RepID=A0A9P5TXW1_9AGAR|nr:hypothetical protein BDP27DRAFT_1373677 [Rhodocollybia butyracea]
MEPACWYKISLHSLHSLCLLLDLCIRTSVTAVGTITKVPECRRDLLVEWLALSKCYEFGISACEKGNNVNSRNGYEAYQGVPQDQGIWDRGAKVSIAATEDRIIASEMGAYVQGLSQYKVKRFQEALHRGDSGELSMVDCLQKVIHLSAIQIAMQ